MLPEAEPDNRSELFTFKANTDVLVTRFVNSVTLAQKGLLSQSGDEPVPCRIEKRTSALTVAPHPRLAKSGYSALNSAIALVNTGSCCIRTVALEATTGAAVARRPINADREMVALRHAREIHNNKANTSKKRNEERERPR